MPPTPAAARPGTILLTTIKGPAGAFVGLGQLISGDASRYQHAGIVDEDGYVIEAAPGGVRKVSLDRYLDGRPLAFGWMIPLTDAQRVQIVAEARGLLRRPYGWSTYLLLALMRLGVRPLWLRKRVGLYKRLICSTLADLVYLRAGVHLFDDGRDPGAVTPGDIANVFIEKDWTPSGTPLPEPYASAPQAPWIAHVHEALQAPTEGPWVPPYEPEPPSYREAPTVDADGMKPYVVPTADRIRKP